MGITRQGGTRDFTLLASGQTLSWLGNGFQTVALSVAVVVGGGGAQELGAVMATTVISMLAGTLIGGVWADRLQPTRVMLASDLVRCAAIAGMALLFTADRHAAWMLCALAAAAGFAGGFFRPAMTALKPMVVSAAELQRANARLAMLQTLSMVIGPALGGMLVGALGAPTGFAFNAATFGVSAVTVSLIVARTDRPPRSRFVHELGEGWQEIRRRDWLLGGVLAATAYHVANGVILVLAQVVVVRDLGGAHAAGLVAAAEGLGGFIGAAIAVRYRPTRMLRAGWLTLMLMPVWALAYVWPGTLVAVILGATVGYAGLSFFSVAWETAIQDHVPHRALARVASWDTLTSFIAMPAGNAMAGPLSSMFGIDPVLIACAGVLLVTSGGPLLLEGSRTLTRPTVADIPAHV